MSEQNVIKLLKDNEKPFGRTSAEMQNKAISIGIVFFEVWSGGKWQKPADVVHCYGATKFLNFAYTYRLRHDYQEEPEIVECEIRKEGDLWYFTDPFGHEHGIGLSVNYCDFIGFKFGDGHVRVSPVLYRYQDGKPDCFTSTDMLEMKTVEVLHATHVLFLRRAK